MGGIRLKRSLTDLLQYCLLTGWEWWDVLMAAHLGTPAGVHCKLDFFPVAFLFRVRSLVWEIFLNRITLSSLFKLCFSQRRFPPSILLEFNIFKALFVPLRVFIFTRFTEVTFRVSNLKKMTGENTLI